MTTTSSSSSPFVLSLISGGIAGTTVDVALYPLDTIKTRLQSSQGFLKSGGFKGVYKGLGAAALGSSPGASLFFCTYETLKTSLRNQDLIALPLPITHMISASIAEIVACLIRVPTEVVKQRMQAGQGASINAVIQDVLSSNNKSNANHVESHNVKFRNISKFYSGFGITIMREIPFSLIQFPLYEFFKGLVSQHRRDRGFGDTSVHSYESAMFGSLSGGIAAAATTPLDVLKTRMMLGSDAKGVPYLGVRDTLTRIMNEEGPRTLFSGVGPRVMWISIGGFVFFGAYEKAKSVLGPII